jgi:hypothetical protein
MVLAFAGSDVVDGVDAGSWNSRRGVHAFAIEADMQTSGANRKASPMQAEVDMDAGSNADSPPES